MWTDNCLKLICNFPHTNKRGKNSQNIIFFLKIIINKKEQCTSVTSNTSPIHIKISKFEGSSIRAEASSQILRKAEAQAFDDTASEIPAARNNLKVAN